MHYNTTNDTLKVYSQGVWQNISETPPVFNTSSGSLGQVTTTTSPTFDIGVTDGVFIPLSSGSLPTGLSLNVITGGVNFWYCGQ